MSISLRPFDIHLGSYVIPKENLHGNTQPNARYTGSTTPFFEKGITLLKHGKAAAAKREFLNMFHCTELNSEHFAEAGLRLTDPPPFKTDVHMTFDPFAKKFLKQAVELGSTDPRVYFRLAHLYIHKPNGQGLEKAEELAEKLSHIQSDTYNIPTTVLAIQLAITINHVRNKTASICPFKL